MDYEKKYKEALERMKSWANGEHPECFSEAQKTAEFIFPELKESEDEIIKKMCIEYLDRGYQHCSFADDRKNIEKCIAWLEKQGESNTFKVPETSIKDAEEVTSRMQYIEDDMKPIAEFIINYANWNLHKDEWNQPTLTVPLFRVLDALIQRGKHYGECVQNIEKQGENKHTDKVEPKFKVGDFIANDYCSGKVIEITNDAYLLDTGQGIPFSCEHNAHLWTIEDAKDGDVLVTTAIRNCPFIYRKTGYNNNLAYYYAGIDGSGDFCEGCIKRTSYHFGPLSNVVPATKEQRDQLFQKMVEAGYEWDSDNKELKKIEPKTLYTDKVIEWLNENVADFWANPCNPNRVINQFKKDFGL